MSDWLLHIGRLLTREMKVWRVRFNRGKSMERYQVRLQELWSLALPDQAGADSVLPDPREDEAILRLMKGLVSVCLVRILRPERFPEENPDPFLLELVKGLGRHRVNKKARIKPIPLNTKRRMGRHLHEAIYKPALKVHQRITQSAIEDAYRRKVLERLVKSDIEEVDRPEFARVVNLEWPDEKDLKKQLGAIREGDPPGRLWER